MASVARGGGGVFEIDLEDRRDSDDEIIDYEEVGIFKLGFLVIFWFFFHRLYLPYLGSL